MVHTTKHHPLIPNYPHNIEAPVWADMSASAVATAFPPLTAGEGCRRLRDDKCILPAASMFFIPQLHWFGDHNRKRLFCLRVPNERSRSQVSPNTSNERSEADKIVDNMDFGELCDEFECISSPLVESTARQLVRDILELREGKRVLGTFAVSVKYKDPVRSFTGREKYKRPLWVTRALDNPSVNVQEMAMLSTSVLRIQWTVRGKPKSVIAALGTEIIVRVTSQFTLNQISGQVIEHVESWDLSPSSPVSQAFFWSSRRLFAIVESGKDFTESVKKLGSSFTTKKESLDVYPDPSGDPTKFFQRDDGFQQDLYQIALFLAVIYFVVQFLRTTL